jgi:hypothetical protein
MHSGQADTLRLVDRLAVSTTRLTVRKITDRLLTNLICPADLLGLRCDWDECLPEGCEMIRLCKVLLFRLSFVSSI